MEMASPRLATCGFGMILPPTDSREEQQEQQQTQEQQAKDKNLA